MSRRRPNAPSHLAIVAANLDLLQTLDSVSYDIEEVAHETCWACGYGNSGFKPTKAHVVRHADGGSMTPDNFFLLCEICHRRQPSGLSRAAQELWLRNSLDWITDMQSRHGVALRKLSEELVASGTNLSDVWRFVETPEFRKQVQLDCDSLFATIPTAIATVYEKFLACPSVA